MPVIFARRGSLTDLAIGALHDIGYIVISYDGECPKMETETLRDVFAAKAMQALLSQPEWIKSISHHKTPDDIQPLTAVAAYNMADALLKQRGQS